MYFIALTIQSKLISINIKEETMKRHSSFLEFTAKAILFVVIILLISNTTTIAQLNDNLRKEILVYIQPKLLEFPANERGSLTIGELNIPSQALKQAFDDFRVQTVTKAFPTFNDGDTTWIREDGTRIKLPQFSRIFRVRLPDTNNVDVAVAILKDIPGILYAEKNSNAHLFSDPTYVNQWYLNNTGQSGGTAGSDISAELAWNIFTGSSNIKIGIIDTGVETNHEDLSSKSSGDQTIGTDYHGTHVAGIAAAKANNPYGGRGVDWNAQILSRRIFESGGYLGDATAASKIIDAVMNGANVLNNSWGGSAYSITVRLAFETAYNLNRVSVVSMGNNNGSQTQYPAGYGKGIIAVGSTQDNDLISPFSNIGYHIDVTAPGGLNSYPNNNQHDIWSTWGDNSYRYLAGTSMAAPVVTGIASLLKGYNTSLYNDDIEHIIQLSSDDKGDPGFDIYYGYGRVNAYKALKLISAPNILVRLGPYTGGTV
jgi:subtilisin family serine protease